MPKRDMLFLLFCLHRSGSSAMAGALHHMGVYMGDTLFGGDESNPKGHFENAHFVELNNCILESAGGTWDNPPSPDRIVKLQYPSAPLRTFLDRARKSVWGLKDPRLLLTYEVWKPYLPGDSDITYVFIHRPLEQSVASLSFRDGMDKARAIQILTPYKRNFDSYKAALKRQDADVMEVDYEEVLREPSFLVNEVNKRLNRPADEGLSVVRSFIDERLKKF